MKDISIGIYHKDHQYGKRLMEYLNHQKEVHTDGLCDKPERFPDDGIIYVG